MYIKSSFSKMIASHAIIVCCLVALFHFLPLASAQSSDVVVLVIQGCPYCDKTEAFLIKKGINYKRYDIEKDAHGKSLYQKLGGGGVPLIKIGSNIIRGFQPDEILMALRSRRPI